MSKKEGWVYVLTNEVMPGIVKIGRSFNSVRRRCRDINRVIDLVPSSGRFQEAWSKKVDDCVRIERESHYLLHPYRVRLDRELFEVSVEIAASAITAAAAGRVPWCKSPGFSVYRSGHKGPRLGRTSKRLRIPALYEWLVMHHDALAECIDETGGAVQSNIVFDHILDLWVETLPGDYPGRIPTPLGVLVEWNRVHREVLASRKAGDCHMVWLLDQD